MAGGKYVDLYELLKHILVSIGSAAGCPHHWGIVDNALSSGNCFNISCQDCWRHAIEQAEKDKPTKMHELKRRRDQ